MECAPTNRFNKRSDFMPFINVKTNVKITEEKAEHIKTELGTAITAIPGKSESWLTVGIEDGYKLWFKGSDKPAAMVEVQLYGGASSHDMSELTSSITGILYENLEIPADRVYVSYMLTEHWGWNGSNF